LVTLLDPRGPYWQKDVLPAGRPLPPPPNLRARKRALEAELFDDVFTALLGRLSGASGEPQAAGLEPLADTEMSGRAADFALALRLPVADLIEWTVTLLPSVSALRVDVHPDPETDDDWLVFTVTTAECDPGRLLAAEDRLYDQLSALTTEQRLPLVFAFQFEP
jgi:hypothetical protein